MSETQQNTSQATSTNDYHQVPATEKQLKFAHQISQQSGVVLPWEVQQNRYSLSRWIEGNRIAKSSGQFANYPSSKQVQFAERIARMKRRKVPHECFKDRTLMSKWIDGNL